MSILQKTYSAESSVNRADFNRNDFENLLQQKGRNVTIEQSLQCPCKSKDSNQQSNCLNCGGTGWVFINPMNTRMIIQGMNITPEYKAWSEEIKGDIKVTASDTQELTYMDRITMLDAQAIHTEVLFFQTIVQDTVTSIFAYTGYAIKEILYIGYFSGVNNAFTRLNNNVDYTFSQNTIKLINPALVAVQGYISITIRYKHAPVYYISEMKRESMESFDYNFGEKLIRLPVMAIARRAHYILDAPDLNGSRLLSNSYVTVTCNGQVNNGCNCPPQAVVLPANVSDGIVIPFTNQTGVAVNHRLNRLVSVTVYDSNDKIMTENVAYVAQATDNNNILVTFPQEQSGTILIL